MSVPASATAVPMAAAAPIAAATSAATHGVLIATLAVRDIDALDAVLRWGRTVAGTGLRVAMVFPISIDR